MAEIDKARDHLANERTYLAWVRTGLATIGLGFVVARFGLVIRDLTGVSVTPGDIFHFSDIVGIGLVVAGGLMEIAALDSYSKTQKAIKSGKYEPTSTIEIVVSLTFFALAMLLIIYLFLTL
jgi:putative membrane protein